MARCHILETLQPPMFVICIQFTIFSLSSVLVKTQDGVTQLFKNIRSDFHLNVSVAMLRIDWWIYVDIYISIIIHFGNFQITSKLPKVNCDPKNIKAVFNSWKETKNCFPLIQGTLIKSHFLVDFMVIFNVEMTEILSLGIEIIARNNKN